MPLVDTLQCYPRVSFPRPALDISPSFGWSLQTLLVASLSNFRWRRLDGESSFGLVTKVYLKGPMRPKFKLQRTIDLLSNFESVPKFSLNREYIISYSLFLSSPLFDISVSCEEILDSLKLVRIVGFEPTASCTRNTRSSQAELHSDGGQ